MLFLFFFNDTATTEIYTLSLHDALPICLPRPSGAARGDEALDLALRHREELRARTAPLAPPQRGERRDRRRAGLRARSEEHTSELQSRQYLVCRLLLEKKKKTPIAPLSL